MPIKTFLVFCFVIIFYSQLFAGESGTPVTKISDNEIVVDGNLTEDIWNHSIKYSAFKQLFPTLGADAAELTEVSLTYDNNNLYFAFRVHYTNKNDIYTSILERDKQMAEDDWIGVAIDTYNDKTSALMFVTNLLGTRRDYEFSNNGRAINEAWNTFWETKSAVTEYGWSSEIKIPFSSLRFEGSENVTMGFRAYRQVKQKGELITFPLEQWNVENPYFNLLNTELITLQNVNNTNPVYVSPFISGRVNQISFLNNEKTTYNRTTDFFSGKKYFNNTALDKILSGIGFDLKYKLNSSATLDFTLNTDFAQAEADDRIINLTRFSIYLPEKRQFFLENEDLFASPAFEYRAFYSRTIGIENSTIVPIIGGLRLSGSSGDFRYGFMNIQSAPVESEEITAKNFSVIRIQKKLNGNDSYIGGYFTNKISTQSKNYNSVFGIDCIYRFSDEIFTGYFAAKSSDSDDPKFRNLAYGFGISKLVNEGWEFYYNYRDFQKNFNSEIGYLQRPDSKRLEAGNLIKFLFSESPFFSRFHFGNQNFVFWNSTTNALQSLQANFILEARFASGQTLTLTPSFNQENLIEPWKFSGSFTVPQDNYKMNKLNFTFLSNLIGNYNYRITGTFGQFFGGSQFSIAPSINYIFGKNFNVNFSFSWNEVSLPESYSQNKKTSEIKTSYSLKLNFFFSSELSIKAYLQYDNKSNQVGSNIRLRYNPAEGTDLYIVMNQNMNVERYSFSPVKPLIESQALIIKYTQTFAF